VSAGVVWERDAWEIADGVRAGSLSARDVLEAHLERIERLDADLNAFCHLDADGARKTADEIDRRVADGDDPGPLAGVPIGVKDGVAVAGMPRTHGSMLYADEVVDFDDVTIERLRGAGVVVVGKTTLPEFGSLNFTRTFVHGVTRNPWNPERTPGGSSGGSAAAVAAGMVPAATGGDGGGSVRIPSSYSGLYGFKGSFGRIPSGPEPYDTSLTSIHGPMVRSVRDAARYVDVVSGPTLTDPTSLPKPSRPYEDVVTSDPAAPLSGLRAAWSSTLGFAVCDPDVEAVTRDAAQRLCAEAGIELVDVEVDLPRMGAAWGLLSSIDLAAWHLDDARDRLDDVTPFARMGFEAWTSELPAEALLRAIRRRHDIMTELARVFSEVDLLLTPTTATVAFDAEGPPPMEIGGQKTSVTGATPYTMAANIAGWPACSIPAGIVDGMPIGVQVMARRHEDDLCFAAGAVVERAHPWPKLAP